MPKTPGISSILLLSNSLPRSLLRRVRLSSDHGSAYGSLLIGKTMRDHGIRPSMGSVESPWDDAPTGSLMGTMKSECVHAKTYRDREQAALEVFECLECFYNRIRLHSALGHVSPMEFEEAYADRPLAA